MELRLDLSLSTGSSPGSDPIQERGNINGEFVVGWPPVKSWRKQLCHHNRRACATNYVNVENSGGGGRRNNSLYVKVKMEGVGIVRKIDLSIHRSYRTLSPKLIALFGKSEENAEYKLMYQNNEGEWLHARDVPWEWFMKSVQRLKLEKKCY
ncbi:hypothetical protein C2S51_034694 [Perilla frutescens var. frutescens]|nr:hypothetical protein C2S51_034694 [Perilla frutescens var. frutescens]